MSPVAALANLFVLIIGVLFVIMPDMSRAGILFGVTVAPDFRGTDAGRDLVRGYRRTIAASTAAILVLGNIIPVSPLWIPMRIGVGGLWGIVCWIQASRKTRAFAQPASSIRVASLAPQPRTLPGGVLFLLGPYLILALAAWFLYANWNSIPEVFPIHWGLDGVPNGWANRTVTGVFGILLVGAATNTITIVLACVIFLQTRNVRVDGGKATDGTAFKRGIFFFILFVSYVVTTILSVMSTRPAWSANPAARPSQMLPFVLTMVAALVAGVIVFFVHIARVARSRGGFGDGTPDACWKWGLFYYNPDDASLFVEKRMGFGWTLNFANKWSWAFITLTLVPTIVILLVGFFAARSTR